MKITELLDTIEDNDLYKLQSDLAKGGSNLRKLIENKIKENETKKQGYCVTCGEDLGNVESAYTLVFGSDELKKKASFCEIDCLEYFLATLKKRGG